MKTLLVLLLCLLAGPALAQSSPNFVTGQTLGASQLNTAFARKTDFGGSATDWLSTYAYGSNGAAVIGENASSGSGLVGSGRTSTAGSGGSAFGGIFWGFADSANTNPAFGIYAECRQFSTSTGYCSAQENDVTTYATSPSTLPFNADAAGATMGLHIAAGGGCGVAGYVCYNPLTGLINLGLANQASAGIQIGTNGANFGVGLLFQCGAVGTTACDGTGNGIAIGLTEGMNEEWFGPSNVPLFNFGVAASTTAFGQLTWSNSGLILQEGSGPSTILTVSNAGLSQPLTLTGTLSVSSPWPVFPNTHFVDVIDLADTGQVTASNAFVNGLTVHCGLGAGSRGGRQCFAPFLDWEGASSVSNVNHNYVADVPTVWVGAPDGGTNTGAGAQGGFFAMNPLCLAGNGAVNLLELTCAEVNFGLQTGSSAKYKYGWSIIEHNTDAVSGATGDGAVLFGALTGAIGVNTLIDVESYNGQYPIKAAGTLLEAGTGTMAETIDTSNATVSSCVLCMASGQKINLGAGLFLYEANAGEIVGGALSTVTEVYPGNGTATQSGGGLLANTGNPASGLGNNGDFYFRTDCTHGASDCTWHKEGGSWFDLN